MLVCPACAVTLSQPSPTPSPRAVCSLFSGSDLRRTLAPCSHLSTIDSRLEQSNAVLATDSLLEHTDVAVMLDNEVLCVLFPVPGALPCALCSLPAVFCSLHYAFCPALSTISVLCALCLVCSLLSACPLLSAVFSLLSDLCRRPVLSLCSLLSAMFSLPCSLCPVLAAAVSMARSVIEG